MNIAEALTELPDTPDAIAAKLLELGCKGRRGNPTDCPVAKYLKLKTGHPTFWVYGSAVLSLEYVSLPAAVSEFLSQFDKKCYPGLIVES